MAVGGSRETPDWTTRDWARRLVAIKLGKPCAGMATKYTARIADLRDRLVEGEMREEDWAILQWGVAGLDDRQVKDMVAWGAIPRGALTQRPAEETGGRAAHRLREAIGDREWREPEGRQDCEKRREIPPVVWQQAKGREGQKGERWQRWRWTVYAVGQGGIVVPDKAWALEERDPGENQPTNPMRVALRGPMTDGGIERGRQWIGDETTAGATFARYAVPEVWGEALREEIVGALEGKPERGARLILRWLFTRIRTGGWEAIEHAAQGRNLKLSERAREHLMDWAAQNEAGSKTRKDIEELVGRS